VHPPSGNRLRRPRDRGDRGARGSAVVSETIRRLDPSFRLPRLDSIARRLIEDWPHRHRPRALRQARQSPNTAKIVLIALKPPLRRGIIARYFKGLSEQIRYLADQWNFAADQRI
jgi:hypothetical protein